MKTVPLLICVLITAFVTPIAVASDAESVPPATVKSTTIVITGSGEPEATIKVYLNDVFVPTATTTVDSAGRWETRITLIADQPTKIEITTTDLAGNESDKELYGYILYEPTVQQLPQKPAELPEPRKTVYHYFEITADSPTLGVIENAEIEFKVSNSWLGTNNIDPATVRLLKYENEQWTELPTVATGIEDENYKYYIATSTGFSTFAVVGEITTADQVPILGVLALIGIVAFAVIFYALYDRGALKRTQGMSERETFQTKKSLDLVNKRWVQI